MNADAREVHEQLLKVLRCYEGPASTCGDRQVVKLTAEQLLGVMEQATQDIARFAFNRAVLAAAELAHARGEPWLGVEILAVLHVDAPVVPVVEVACAVCSCGPGSDESGCGACRDYGGAR